MITTFIKSVSKKVLVLAHIMIVHFPFVGVLLALKRLFDVVKYGIFVCWCIIVCILVLWVVRFPFLGPYLH